MTVAVILAAVLAVTLAVLAALEHDVFWISHSSNEKPGPEKEIQDSYWCPQAADAAEAMSSKTSSRTVKDSPFFPTDGQRPPRERTNSKKVSMTVTF